MVNLTFLGLKEMWHFYIYRIQNVCRIRLACSEAQRGPGEAVSNLTPIYWSIRFRGLFQSPAAKAFCDITPPVFTHGATGHGGQTGALFRLVIPLKHVHKRVASISAGCVSERVRKSLSFGVRVPPAVRDLIFSCGSWIIHNFHAACTAHVLWETHSTAGVRNALSGMSEGLYLFKSVTWLGNRLLTN